MDSSKLTVTNYIPGTSEISLLELQANAFRHQQLQEPTPLTTTSPAATTSWINRQKLIRVLDEALQILDDDDDDDEGLFASGPFDFRHPRIGGNGSASTQQ